MACSPEQSRINGSKSKGAITERGKAIAAQNATKHGMLAAKPPVLATEDLETFQGIIQGLIDEHEPATPTEHLFVQQIAMAWLRLYRLWGVEAAQADELILAQQLEQRYPDFSDNPFEAYLPPSTSWAEARTIEQQAFQFLVGALTELSLQHPDKPQQQRKWLQVVKAELTEVHRESLRARHSDRKHFDQEFWLKWGELYDLFYDSDREVYHSPSPDVANVKTAMAQLIEAANQEIEQIDRELSDVKQLKQGLAIAKADSKGLPNPELFSRYERHINNQLQQALDRLAQMQAQRKNEGSMGSFG